MYDDFKVINYDKSLASPEGYGRHMSRLFSGDIIDGYTLTPGTGLQTVLAPGNAFLRYGSAATESARHVSLLAPFTLTHDPADASNPRIDLIVIYVDNGVSLPSGTPTSANLDGKGVHKAKIVKGAASAVPSAPNATAIQASVGAGNPYSTVEEVRVNAGVSSISAGNITDVRKLAKIGSSKLDFTTLGYVSSRSSTSVAMTTSDQVILTVDVSHFPTGAVLEIQASTEAGGDNNLIALILATNVTPAYVQATTWGRTLSFAETWIKTSAVNTISLVARKDNATVLNVSDRTLSVKRVG